MPGAGDSAWMFGDWAGCWAIWPNPQKPAENVDRGEAMATKLATARIGGKSAGKWVGGRPDEERGIKKKEREKKE